MVRTLQTFLTCLDVCGLEDGFRKLCEDVPCNGSFRVKRNGEFDEDAHPEVAVRMHDVAAKVKHILASKFNLTVKFGKLTIHHRNGVDPMRIDLVVQSGRDYCWMELKWTRKGLECDGSEVNVLAREKEQLFQKAQQRLRDWRRDSNQGGGPVFPAQRLGVLFVSPDGFRIRSQDGNDFLHYYPTPTSSSRSGLSNWQSFNDVETATGNKRKRAYAATSDGVDSI